MAKGIKTLLQENDHSSTWNLSWVRRLSEKIGEATTTDEYKKINDEGRGLEVLMKLETCKSGINRVSELDGQEVMIRKWDVWSESMAVVSNEKVEVVTT